MQVYQRQLSKEGLQSLVNNASAAGGGGGGPDVALSSMSAEELRDLFTLRADTCSDTYDSMCCRCESPPTPASVTMAQRGARQDALPGTSRAAAGSVALHDSQT